MTEPKYENFEDPKDYFSAKCGWLQARVQELEDSLCARQREVADLKDGKRNAQENGDRLRGQAKFYQDLHDKSEAEVTRLREALGEYGHHKPRCKLDPCDCGILEALREKP